MPCFQPKERVGILGVFLSKTFPFTVLKLWGARCNREKAGYFYNYSVYVMYHSCNKSCESVMRKSYHCSNKSNYDEDTSGEDWYYMMASEAKEKLD